MVTPETFTPFSIACPTASFPGNDGSKDGCTLTIFPSYASSNVSPTILIYPARAIHCTLARFNLVIISFSYASLFGNVFGSNTTVSVPKLAALPVTCAFGLSQINITTSNCRSSLFIMASKFVPVPDAKTATRGRISKLIQNALLLFQSLFQSYLQFLQLLLV